MITKVLLCFRLPWPVRRTQNCLSSLTCGCRMHACGSLFFKKRSTTTSIYLHAGLENGVAWRETYYFSDDNMLALYEHLRPMRQNQQTSHIQPERSI